VEGPVDSLVPRRAADELGLDRVRWTTQQGGDGEFAILPVGAPDLKAALRAFPHANVALIVSDEIYRGVVRPYGKPRPDRFREIDVVMPEKGFASGAWIFVPDEDVTRLDPVVAGPEPKEAPAAASRQRFNIGSVQGQSIGIGDNHTFTTMPPRS
jgi:hypothetical protein